MTHNNEENSPSNQPKPESAFRTKAANLFYATQTPKGAVIVSIVGLLMLFINPLLGYIVSIAALLLCYLVMEQLKRHHFDRFTAPKGKGVVVVAVIIISISLLFGFAAVLNQIGLFFLLVIAAAVIITVLYMANLGLGD